MIKHKQPARSEERSSCGPVSFVMERGSIRDQNAGNIPQNISGGGNVDSSSYVTKAEFDDLKMKFEAFCAKKPVKQQKKEDTIDE